MLYTTTTSGNRWSTVYETVTSVSEIQTTQTESVNAGPLSNYWVWGGLLCQLYFVHSVMSMINLQVLTDRWDNFCSDWSGVYFQTRKLNPRVSICRFLVSGINGKNCAMGFFSDSCVLLSSDCHESSSKDFVLFFFDPKRQGSVKKNVNLNIWCTEN